jgi:hypothetical protein
MFGKKHLRKKHRADMEDKLERLGEEMDKHIERIESGKVDASNGLVLFY